MARAAKTTPPAKRVPAGKPPGRAAAPPARPAKPVARVPRAAAAPVAERAPKVSKDELRAQVEKLDRTIATLRAKARETTRAAKGAAARIAELEAEVARLEAAAARQAAPPKPAKTARPRAKAPGRDPGDSVPPGVAVQEPEPLDAEAEAAREALEEHLSGE